MRPDRNHVHVDERASTIHLRQGSAKAISRYHPAQAQRMARRNARRPPGHHHATRRAEVEVGSRSRGSAVGMPSGRGGYCAMRGGTETRRQATCPVRSRSTEADGGPARTRDERRPATRGEGEPGFGRKAIPVTLPGPDATHGDARRSKYPAVTTHYEMNKSIQQESGSSQGASREMLTRRRPGKTRRRRANTIKQNDSRDAPARSEADESLSRTHAEEMARFRRKTIPATLSDLDTIRRNDTQ